MPQIKVSAHRIRTDNGGKSGRSGAGCLVAVTSGLLLLKLLLLLLVLLRQHRSHPRRKRHLRPPSGGCEPVQRGTH